MPRTVTWLHLSDLHACRPKSGWDAKRVLDALRIDLQTMNRKHDLRPDLIFFTGDAAFGHISNERGEAISDQFREADDFLTAVRETFDPAVPKRNLFLVPGNRDVNRTLITSMDTDWLAKPHTRDEMEQMLRDSRPERAMNGRKARTTVTISSAWTSTRPAATLGCVSTIRRGVVGDRASSLERRTTRDGGRSIICIAGWGLS